MTGENIKKFGKNNFFWSFFWYRRVLYQSSQSCSETIVSTGVSVQGISFLSFVIERILNVPNWLEAFHFCFFRVFLWYPGSVSHFEVFDNSPLYWSVCSFIITKHDYLGFVAFTGSTCLICSWVKTWGNSMNIALGDGIWVLRKISPMQCSSQCSIENCFHSFGGADGIKTTVAFWWIGFGTFNITTSLSTK